MSEKIALHCSCNKFLIVNSNNKTKFKWKVYKTGVISCEVKRLMWFS